MKSAESKSRAMVWQRPSPSVIASAFALALVASPLPAQLPPSSRDVELRVVDAKGGPIQDLRLTVYGAVDGGDRCRVLPGQTRTLRPQDFADDHARLRDLPDGDLVLAVEADGHALTLSKPFTLPAKSAVRMTLSMHAGATLRGTVTTPNGEPVAGATVRTAAREDDNQHPFLKQLGQLFVVPVTPTAAQTADDGSFRLTHVAPGSYVVRAAHGDWADARIEVTVKGKGEQKLAALKLEPGGVLAGAVERSGKRLADVVVVLQSPPEPRKGAIDFRAVRVEVRTDAEGRFTLPRVPFGAYELAAHEGGEPLAQALQLSSSKRTVELKAQPGGGPQQELLLLSGK
jgi:hypothetical protein